MLTSGKVFDWLKRIAKPAPAPLTGAPAVRRQKTHSAMSGYVYQYYYEGHRPAELAAGGALEFVFEVCPDRKTSFPVSVFLMRSALEAWQSAHRRELSSTEQYAIAKMALFEAFDQRETPQKMREAVVVEEAGVDTILATLDID
jgi:hypothetical protein